MKMFSYRDVSTLYVCPGCSGSGKTPDKNAGGDAPLEGLERAFSLIEQMRGGGMLQPITLKLMAGNYCLSSAVRIRDTMSNVTVEPFGDGEVLISGGRKITGFTESAFNGVFCYAAHIPEVENGSWRFTDLYVDGLRAEFTRYPETGYLHMGETEFSDGALAHSSRWFTAAKEDIEKFSSLYAFEDCIVSFNHYWIDEHTPVDALDRETGRVTMTYLSRFTIRPGQEYILENVAETFGKPNQWYLDRKNGMLYYIPRNKEQTPDSVDVWAPVTSKLFDVHGTAGSPVTGVRFNNLTLAYTRGDYGSAANELGVAGKLCASDAQAVANADGSVSFAYARNIVFDHCTMRNYGVHGFNITEGCRSIKIRNCTMYDGGAGGVRICGGVYGSPAETMTGGCTVSDCSITHVGRRYLSACGVLVMHAFENDIIHNEIGDLYYTGVSCGWTWGYAKTVCRDNHIEKNHIYDLGKGELSDMGGVYLLGSQPGTVVSGNVIHDIKCKEYGGWALYTDEGSAGILLEKNLCYNTSSNSYHQHYGTSNVVRNNIFADAGQTLLRVSRQEPHLSILFTNNILYSSGTPMLDDYSNPGLGFRFEDGAIVSGGNLFFCHTGEMRYTGGDRLKTLSDAQAADMEYGSIEADPCFADPEHQDFTLKPESPAFALGFVMPDYSDVGPR